jgi:glyoxylase-like metal-dependent hydrolase (beta-lactamase superfamily II)
MSPAEGGLAVLRFPHAAPPPAGTAWEVAPGVRWLRMPLPFALDHINLWLIEDDDGWAIVDTGINSLETKSLWERILAEAVDGRPATRLICTHYHPDHIGLAGWLTDRLGIELAMTETEWRFGYERSLATQQGIHPLTAQMYRRVGMRGDALTKVGIARAGHYVSRVSPVPERHQRLVHGMELAIGGRTWRIIVGRGHAPEHACLYCPALDLLIAGDQVLPKISPNVSLWPQDLDPDPLGSFLASLETLRRGVPSTAFVLPSHNLPFYGLHERLEQLRVLHETRLSQIEAACDLPRSTAEIMPLLFSRALDQHQLGFAVGETLAHLIHATHQGRIKRNELADGVWMFERAEVRARQG